MAEEIYIADLQRRFFEGHLPPQYLMPDVKVPPGALIKTPTTNVAEPSITVTGNRSAPNAGAIIAETPALTGLYRVEVDTAFTGSGLLSVVDANNFVFRVGNVEKFRPFAAPVQNGQSKIYCVNFRANNETFSVIAKLGGSILVNYWANIIATKIGD